MLVVAVLVLFDETVDAMFRALVVRYNFKDVGKTE